MFYTNTRSPVKPILQNLSSCDTAERASSDLGSSALPSAHAERPRDTRRDRAPPRCQSHSRLPARPAPGVPARSRSRRTSLRLARGRHRRVGPASGTTPPSLSGRSTAQYEAEAPRPATSQTASREERMACHAGRETRRQDGEGRPSTRHAAAPRRANVRKEPDRGHSQAGGFRLRCR